MKNNKLVRGILTTASTAIATAVVTPMIDTCIKTVSDKMTYTVDLTNAEMYMSSGIKKYFKNIPDRLLIETSSAYKDGFNMEFIKNISAWDISTANYIETIFWKGIPITAPTAAWTPWRSPITGAWRRAMTMTTAGPMRT